MINELVILPGASPWEPTAENIDANILRLEELMVIRNQFDDSIYDLASILSDATTTSSNLKDLYKSMKKSSRLLTDWINQENGVL